MIEMLKSLLAWLGGHPEVRILAGFVFLALFGSLFFRLSRGTGKWVFVILSAGLATLFWVSPWAHIFAWPVLAGLLIWVLQREKTRTALYQEATVLAEGGGIKRGLAAPEAALALEMPARSVVAAVLVAMHRKGMLQARVDPLLVLEVAPDFRTRQLLPDVQVRAAHRRAAAQHHRAMLHPYEEPFLELLEEKAGQPLKEIDFAAPLRALAQYTEQRIEGYDREGTREYYRKHLGRARHDVLGISEGGDGARLRDHHLEWLLLDGEFARLYRDYQPSWLPAGEQGVESWGKKIKANLNSK